MEVFPQGPLSWACGRLSPPVVHRGLPDSVCVCAPVPLLVGTPVRLDEGPPHALILTKCPLSGPYLQIWPHSGALRVRASRYEFGGIQFIP